MSPARSPTRIAFEALVIAIDGSTILRLPQQASRDLPSRGQVAVEGTINGCSFGTVVEPDGRFGHWIGIDERLQRSVGLRDGDVARVEMEPVTDWPEPAVPDDLSAALRKAPQQIQAVWADITPMARWEWVRWVNETRNPETRRRRVDVTISKMESGKRRPCCFNLAACTDPQLSRNGKLIELA